MCRTAARRHEEVTAIAADAEALGADVTASRRLSVERSQAVAATWKDTNNIGTFDFTADRDGPTLEGTVGQAVNLPPSDGPPSLTLDMADSPLTHPYAPNPVLRALYSRFFSKIQVEEEWIRRVRSAAELGTVVYVQRNLNFIDFLALDHLTKVHGLPQVRFANDLGLWVLNPMMGRHWWERRSVTPADELRDALSHGGSAALFLKRPPRVLDVAAGASGGRGLREGDELVSSLIAHQRSSERPILLIPQVFLWTNRPDTLGTKPVDLVFGPREWPSAMRTVGQFLSNYKHVALRAGEPLDLKDFLEKQPPAVTDETLQRRVTYVMLRRLERERRAITGPAQKPPDRVRHEITRSPKFRAELERACRRGRVPLPEAMRKAEGMLRDLQAAPDGTAVRGMESLLNGVFNRIYAGIDVDPDGLAELQRLSRNGSLVLLPSHKSHVDYLILSYVFNGANLPLPLVAAGDNLNFFPIGAILRRLGAFFIRRSFRGDPLYPPVVDAYVRRSIREGYPIELFLEGGRSRTGKLLTPKFGLLKMVVSAAEAVPTRTTYFIPVSIGYERIVETKAFQRELSGEEKVREDAAGLLNATGVLRHRYGTINLQFGTALTLDEIKKDLGIDDSPKKRDERAVVQHLANRVMDEINRVTAVTPGALAALALLSCGRRGLVHSDLIARSGRLLAVLQSIGARTTPALVAGGKLRSESIREAMQMFIDGELVQAYPAAALGAMSKRLSAGPAAVYTIPDVKRLELDTSKNLILHFLVRRAILATALDTSDTAEGTVRKRFVALVALLKGEFRFDPNVSEDEAFDQVVQEMLDASEIERQDGSIVAGPGHHGWNGGEWLSSYRRMIQNFVEGYLIAARSTALLLVAPLGEKELTKRALTLGAQMHLSGEIDCKEALSKSLLVNGYASFVELGFLVRRADGYALAEPCASEPGVAAITEHVEQFLDPAMATSLRSARDKRGMV